MRSKWPWTSGISHFESWQAFKTSSQILTTLSDNKMLFCLRLEERPEVYCSLGGPEEGGGGFGFCKASPGRRQLQFAQGHDIK